MTTFLYWSPRLLTIAFAAFLALFAPSSSLIGFLMQLIPSLLVLAVLAIAWRREWFGAVLFLALGLFYVITSWGRFPLVTYVAIAGPMVVIAGLFLAGWRVRLQSLGSCD